MPNGMYGGVRGERKSPLLDFTGNQLRLPVNKKEDPAKKCGMKGNRKDQKKYFEKNEKRG